MCGEDVGKLRTGSHYFGLKAKLTRGLNVGLRVVEEQGFFRAYAKGLHRMVKYPAVGLHGACLEGGDCTIEIVGQVMTVLPEFRGDTRMPHDGIRVAQQKYPVSSVEFFETSQALYGDAGEKTTESLIYLTVGNFAGYKLTNLATEFCGINHTFFKPHERAFLRILT